MMERKWVCMVILVTLLKAEHTLADCKKNEECVTDLSQEDCPSGTYLVQNSAINECCPACEELGGLEDICTSAKPCAPGLKCVERECVLDRESCLHTQHLPEDQQPFYPPDCNPDGSYAPVQCKGDSIVGRCFCYNAKGRRIFGLDWAEDAEDMTCACSRRRSELELEGRTDVTLHCSTNGNYEPVQCDSGLCWCADPQTGKPESMVLSEEMIPQLPCYDPDKLGAQYLRKCESMSYAIARIKNKLALHGTGQVSMITVNCDYDGTYGSYQIENGIAYCSWRDSSRIGPWQTDAGANLDLVNCNCARDTKYYAEVGKTMTLTCTGNGNYMPQQQLNGKPYCVDTDGFPTTELLVPGSEIDCSKPR